MHLTDGARRLRDATTGETQAAIASRLRITQQSVSELLRGRTRPQRLVLLMRLAREYGIPLEAWLTPAEARELARAGRAGGRARRPAAEGA